MQPRTDTDILPKPLLPPAQQHLRPHRRSRSRTAENPSEITFYPAYCYKASPTWFTWVKLTAHNVHYTLESKPKYHNTTLNHGFVLNNSWAYGYEKPGLFFYLNHPIQFVQLVGVVVSIEDHFEKFWLITLDDSSGATIEVNCRKPVKLRPSRNIAIEEEDGATTSTSTTITLEGDGLAQDTETKIRTDLMAQLEIGMVIQVKGTISTFRDVRQLRLERLAVVPDTSCEMRLVAARCEFWNTVLSFPWTLLQSQQKAMLELARDDKEAQIHRASRMKRKGTLALEREKRHEMRLLQQYEKDEVRRAACANAAKQAGELLRSQKP